LIVLRRNFAESFIKIKITFSFGSSRILSNAFDAFLFKYSILSIKIIFSQLLNDDLLQNDIISLISFTFIDFLSSSI